MISETEQTLLLVTSAIIIAGTLVVLLWQLVRSRRGRGPRDGE
ncbi:hypothetical protein [Microbacterium invictum]|uniref:LPXTG cell wall anchor domain-containing protein n=1 Tax=Microbacterium invictum TaxID=515415 RepID=A0ABZ0V9A8_9MICO|nr:hypothetical protein [Microbacterium invictum]WQB70212.1 hypothetical protein T9R20_16165 [Microbacterium invictum]